MNRKALITIGIITIFLTTSFIPISNNMANTDSSHNAINNNDANNVYRIGKKYTIRILR